MQIDNKFIAFFLDSTTAPGSPITGLSATITIIDSNGNIPVDEEPMIELGRGRYSYIFTGMDITKEYSYDCNPNSSLAFIESGVTNNVLYKWIEDNRSGGGAGGSINISGIQATIRNSGEKVIKELSDKIKESEEYICNDIEEKKLDIEPILTKIDSIEIPEHKLEEKEAKKTLKLLTTLDKKVSSYIDKEKSEKEQEMMKEHESKVSELVDKIEEMEEAYSELDLTISDKEKLIEDMESTAEEIISELENEKGNAKSIAKKEIISSLSE